jgi:hypothetical protein
VDREAKIAGFLQTMINWMIWSAIIGIGVTWAQVQSLDEGPPVRLAQQTVAVPPPPSPLPSTFPKTQAFTSCVMNCDTSAGMCQGRCSVSNSPTVTFASRSTGVAPDPGALTQCYLNCSTQQLACKQTCSAPP